MSSTVHDHGERWDDSDVASLKERLARDETYEEIAEHMGRTRTAVASKVKRLRKKGMTLPHPSPEPEHAPNPEVEVIPDPPRKRFGRRR